MCGCLYDRLLVCLPVYLIVCLSVCLFVCRFVSLVRLCVIQMFTCVCLSVRESLFDRLVVCDWLFVCVWWVAGSCVRVLANVCMCVCSGLLECVYDRLVNW